MNFLFLIALSFFSASALAVSDDLDLAIKDSIERHFSEYHRKVDLSRLDYYGKPIVQNEIITSETSVWAERGFSDKWGWHICSTKLKDLGSSNYEDLGSDCYFDAD